MTSLSVSTLKADTLDCSTRSNIVAGNTAAASDVKTCMDNIVTWSTNITDTNIKSGAAIDATKISGTALTLSGSQTVTGNKTFNGDVDFGDAATDTVTFTSAIDSNLVFEGATADGFETTFSITDPTADRTITVPDADVDLTGGLGKIVQVVRTNYNTYASLGTTAIPIDDTIPTWAEGNEVSGLATAITPTNASNILIIDVNAYFSSSGSGLRDAVLCMFADGTGTDPAIAVSANESFLDGSQMTAVRLRHIVTAGSTSARTYGFRVGDDGGSTFVINGKAAATAGRLYGGVVYSTVTITEIKA